MNSCGKGNRPRSFQRETQAGQHREVKVKLDALRPTDAKRCESDAPISGDSGEHQCNR